MRKIRGGIFKNIYLFIFLNIEHEQIPVLIKLDGKVSHVLQGFVGKRHVHVHMALTAGERSGNFQPFRLDCW